MPSEARSDDGDDDVTYDETKWMAVAIELLVIIAALAFAVLESR